MPSPEISRRTFVAAGAAAALTAWAASPSAAAPTRTALVAARQRFFGSDHVDSASGDVDPSKVILSWFGVTNFALAIGGAVVLLDAWVPRGLYSAVVPTSPEELAALAPSHIFIGHGHFDHAADAADIAKSSGAVVIGTSEHCTQISNQGGGTALRTSPVDDGTALTIADGVAVHVVRHIHSASRPPSGSPDILALPPDFGPVVQHPPTLQDIQHLRSHYNDPEGGSLLYQFRVGDFVLTWHDSSGPLRTDAPQILDTLRTLPASTVQVGSIQGYNQYTNGLRDPIEYIRALRPTIFVPAHHDNWLPPLSVPAAEWRPALNQAFTALTSPPELRMLTDPQDYVRPQLLTFNISR